MEKGQSIQIAKRKKANNDLQRTTQKTEDLSQRNRGRHQVLRKGYS